MIPYDKKLHFAVSCLIELALGAILPSWLPWWRFVVNVGVFGCGKELYDYRHPESHDADWRDIVADAAGALAGEIIICLLGA